MNQYKEHIKRLRDDYNAAVYASSPFYDEPEDYRSWELDYEAHASACASIVADAYRNGDYAHMWEALNESLDERDDPSRRADRRHPFRNHQRTTMGHTTHKPGHVQ